MSPNSAANAEVAFEQFLTRVEDGESVDFEAWVADRGELTPRLRTMHRRWRALAAAFESVQGDVAATAGSEPALPTELGGGDGHGHRYVLRDELARGGMGRIVLAWDRELRREVALKLLHNGSDLRLQRRFVEEAQITAQLDHPGIVPIHELGTDGNGQRFFAMRLVRGQSLEKVLAGVAAGTKEWSPTRVLHALERVCEAVAFAHDRGVVHRDLKPANIMVGRFGETYVMDWGLARVLGTSAAPSAEAVATGRAAIAADDDASPLLTRAGDVIGTPSYMAPEQATGRDAAIAPAVDVYALGAILYHLLAGAPPYHSESGSSVEQVLQDLRQRPPTPLPTTAPDELRAICERAMAREPAARYASAQALGDELRAYLDGRVVFAHATGMVAELRKWIGRNRALATACGAFAMLLALSTVVTLLLWLAADSAKQRADSTAIDLANQLDHSRFRNARLSLRADDAAGAADILWNHHFDGRMGRASHWGLLEYAEHDRLLATTPLHGHGQPVFANGGRDVLYVDGGPTIRVYDANTLAPAAEMADGDVHFTTITTSSTHAIAVTGDKEGNVTVWDLERRTVVHRGHAHAAPVEQVQFAPDGVAFASADAEGQVLLWAKHDAEPEPVAKVSRRVTALAFDAASHRLAITDDLNHLVVIARGQGTVLDLSLGDSRLLTCCFAAADVVWVGGRDLHIVDLRERKVVRSLPTRNGTCRHLLRDHDGSMFVGGWWRIDRLRSDGQTESTVALHDVWHMAIDPATRRLVVKRDGPGLDVVDTQRPDVKRIGGGNVPVALAPDGNTACVCAGDAIVRIDLATNQQTGRAPAAAGWLACDPHAKFALSMSSGKGITVVDLDRGEVAWRAPCTDDVGFNESAQFSPNGEEIAAVVTADTVRRFRATDGAILGDLQMPGSSILRLRWSGDGKHIATIRRRHADVRVFNLVTEDHRDESFARRLPSGDSFAPASLAINHDGSRIAVGGWEGSIIIRNVGTGNDQRLQSHAGTTWSLAFAATDHDLLVASTGAGGITFWDLASGEACYQTQGLEGPLVQAQVSDDCRTLVCVNHMGIFALDLVYHERHIANGLDSALARRLETAPLPAGRERDLRNWAARVREQPWPRWR